MKDLSYTKNCDAVLEEYHTTRNGIDPKEIAVRQQQYGKNILPKGKKNTIWTVFFRQFKDPIVIVLFLTAIFSFIVGEVVDTIVILLIILSDGLLGTYQEWKAEKKAESLENMVRVKTLVIRDGKEQIIDSEELVVGDLVKLESGAKVSADLRMLEVSNLSIDESFLTGESMPSIKITEPLDEHTSLADRENMCYSGSVVLSGRGTGIVVATGIHTELGKIAHHVLSEDTTKPPLIIRMEKFTKQVSYAIAIMAILLSFLLYVLGYSPKEIFFVVIALAIAAVPEGLPVSLTVALSIASNRMAKRNVIVRKLNAVESLGSCTVIASDKTGTLTLNEQTAKKIILKNDSVYEVSGIGYHADGQVTLLEGKEDPYLLKQFGLHIALNNEALLEKKINWEASGDSIDIAFLALSYKIGIAQDIRKQTNILKVIPYESEKKYSAVFYEADSIIVTAKGSFETLMAFCDDDKIKWQKQHDTLAQQGYRVLAIASGCVDRIPENDLLPNMQIDGLVGFIDPIRKESRSAVCACHEAGIKVVMVTGDHPLTAKTIAQELGILNNGEVLTTQDISYYQSLGEQAFDEIVSKTTVFSRMTPLQKVAIVESFQRQNEFIAVAGDGVNDAPAMKKANIGIAMGSGSDVAKETAAMIITDDNFSSIVAGIEEGRFAYDNIRKVIYMLISCGVAEVIFFALAILFGMPLPLLAIQLLWLNLVTNGIQDIALAFEAGENGVMRRPPRDPNETIFNKLLLKETFLSGSVISVILFGVFYFLLSQKISIEQARSYILLLMVFLQNVQVLNCRSELTSVFKIPFKNNRFIVIGVVTTLLLQLFILTIPIFREALHLYSISIPQLLFFIPFILLLITIMELFKWIERKKEKNYA